MRWVAACAVDSDGRWLMRRIDEGPILRGLWLPPVRDLEGGDDPVKEATRLLPFDVTSIPIAGPIVRHNITHRRIDVITFLFDVPHAEPPSDAWRWVDPRDPGVPTSSLLAKLAGVWPE